MALIFEIIKITTLHNRGQFIFARFTNGELNFEMKDGSTLGGVPICNYLEMPRLLDENKQPRLDIFVFRPLRSFPEVTFIEGQRVELVLLK